MARPKHRAHKQAHSNDSSRGAGISDRPGELPAGEDNRNVRQDEEVPVECAICYDTMENGRRLSCGHTFCPKCTKKIVGTDARCPLDRSAIPPSKTTVIVKSLVKLAKSTSISVVDIFIAHMLSRNHTLRGMLGEVMLSVIAILYFLRLTIGIVVEFNRRGSAIRFFFWRFCLQMVEGVAAARTRCLGLGYAMLEVVRIFILAIAILTVNRKYEPTIALLLCHTLLGHVEHQLLGRLADDIEATQEEGWTWEEAG